MSNAVVFMRAALQQLLETYRPQTLEEQAALARMRFFARQLESPGSRSQSPAHFTASALVVDEAMERVCLVHHKALGRWLQPGGHLEVSDASVAEAALREAREETGLAVWLHPNAGQPFDLDIHAIPARAGAPEHEHLDVRFLVLGNGELRHDPSESLAVRWWPLAEATASADDASVRRLLAKLAALKASLGCAKTDSSRLGGR